MDGLSLEVLEVYVYLVFWFTWVGLNDQVGLSSKNYCTLFILGERNIINIRNVDKKCTYELTS